METLKTKQMENLNGGNCLGVAAGILGVGIGVATAEVGFGIAIAAEGVLTIASNAGGCEEQLEGTWLGELLHS